MKANLLCWLQEAYPTIANEWGALMGGKTPKHLVKLNEAWETTTFVDFEADELRALVNEDLGWFIMNNPGVANPDIWVDADELIEIFTEGSWAFEDSMDEDEIRANWRDAEDMDVVFIPADDRDWSLNGGFFTTYKIPAQTPTPAPKRRK